MKTTKHRPRHRRRPGRCFLSFVAAYSVVLRWKRCDASGTKIASTRHEAENDDLEHRIRQVLTDETVPVRDRVRMACAFGAVIGGLLMAGDAFSSVPAADLGAMVKRVVHDVLTPPEVS